MELKPLLETNVYTLRGRVLIAGACLPEVWPEAFAALAAEADQVFPCAWRRATSTWPSPS